VREIGGDRYESLEAAQEAFLPDLAVCLACHIRAERERVTALAE
jgi:hypothetical protein